ncbi:MAG: zinc metallopeptidase [Planctomycetes bacterium]|nr:zinc metallopeptidase [Planctomycetota bacterium]
MYFDLNLLIFTSPAILLMLWAQWRVKSAYHHGMQVPAPLSGAAAARHILDSSGCHEVGVEVAQGWLSDHYDPSSRVLRLSPEVYESHTATAVGIAAHEAGHAIQHANHYAPLVVRNIAVPAAQFGGTAFWILLMLGLALSSFKLILLGIAAFGCTTLFQIINLPVEFDASNRAKRLLGQLSIVDGEGALAVRSVLNAAGWTYIAATLQSLMTLIYYLIRFGVLSSSRDD